MILLGDEFITCENTSKIDDISHISSTKANSTLLFTYNLELLKYCHNNTLPFGVKVNDIKELIYASQFGAKYLICKQDMVQSAQKIAENYMFDAKILLIIENSDEIVWVAQNEIDGAIYNTLIS